MTAKCAQAQSTNLSPLTQNYLVCFVLSAIAAGSPLTFLPTLLQSLVSINRIASTQNQPFTLPTNPSILARLYLRTHDLPTTVASHLFYHFRIFPTLVLNGFISMINFSGIIMSVTIWVHITLMLYHSYSVIDTLVLERAMKSCLT